MKPDDFFITPTSSGVRIVVKGVSFYRPYTPDMLLNMGQRFVDAAKEAYRTPKDGAPHEKVSA